MKRHILPTISLINTKNNTSAQATKRWLIFTSVSILGLLIFLFSLSFQDIKQWYMQKKMIQTLQHKLDAILPAAEKYQTLLQQKNNIIKHQKKITGYQHHENRPIQMLNQLISLASEELSYNHITIDKKKIELTILASNMTIVHAFIKQFSDEKVIKKVHISSIRYDNETGEYICSLQAQIQKI